jgi:nicotinamidase-related amidase
MRSKVQNLTPAFRPPLSHEERGINLKTEGCMKHKHTLTKSKTALLVIDVQDKFAPVIPDFDNLVTNATRLVLTFEMFKMPVVVTEQYPEGLGNTVDKIEEMFAVLEVVEKMELAATDNRQFMEKINKLGCETFVVCGIETHICVNQTVLGLLAQGKTVHVVADAVGSRHAIDHSAGLRKMENAGALITSAETVMFELAERAGTESFRNIQTMVKGSKTKNAAGTARPSKRPDTRKAPEKETAPAAPSQEERERAATVPPEGITHSASDIDTAEEADLSDMLASIGAKVDAQETIGPVSKEVDKDIADLDEIIKAEERTEKEGPEEK